MAAQAAMSPDVLITIKLQIGLENRRFKLPLKELGANTLPDKLRFLLAIDPSKAIIFERYSDSAGSFITLDSSNQAVYKQLYRAAKAKLKLRIRATVLDVEVHKVEAAQPEPITQDRLTSQTYVPPQHEVTKPVEPMFGELPKAATPPAPAALSPLQTMRLHRDAAEKLQRANDELFRRRTGELQRKEYAALLRNTLAACAQAANKAEATVAAQEPSAEIETDTTATKQASEEEAPVPCEFSERERFYADLANLSKYGRTTESLTGQDFHVPSAAFTVCCNKCHATIPNAHWHCSICDDGDFDLCRECATNGNHCGVEGHYMIKRSIENGKVISSTTETVPRKLNVEAKKEVPGAYTEEVKEAPLPRTSQMCRTCNSCVNAFEESNFVTCLVCEDYDLCIPCHVGLKHGHHPSHAFAPVSEEQTLDALATQLLCPGRNMRHMATCDGCDKNIYGVRNKCMSCPDWDYCSTCIKTARQNHPGHRFVPIYETIATPFHATQRHIGINCDGPLCVYSRSYVRGDRYKCAVCHDTDFCANCEALPTNPHNRTHPLIKFRTPVRNVSVTTLGEKENGDAMPSMGDQLPQTMSKATETTPATQSANAATQVQTIAEVKPTELMKKEVDDEKTKPATTLQAHFVRDTIPDGSKLPAGCQTQQEWVLRNPGPDAWPVGCSVRYIGGDNMMLNLDSNHPSSVSEMGNALESNVMERPVEVGEEVCFFVPIKAPQRPGKAISYWRLKTVDGIPFGHKLWCDIDVVEPQPSTAEILHAESYQRNRIRSIMRSCNPTWVSEPAKFEQNLNENPAKEHNENVDGDDTDLPRSEHIEHAEPKVKKEDSKVKIEDVGIKQEPKEEAQTSQMIFPKLEKESPVSSTHEAQSQDQNVAVAAAEAVSAIEQQLLDDVESLELDDEETSDDGFLTDEEYEILEYEEEEAVNGGK